MGRMCWLCRHAAWETATDEGVCLSIYCGPGPSALLGWAFLDLGAEIGMFYKELCSSSHGCLGPAGPADAAPTDKTAVRL